MAVTEANVSAGEQLWQRATAIIPGGSMLLSKRAEMYLPRGWPAYFSRAKGCRVWDLDDREYLDVGPMGVGTNILGYGYPKVDEAVRRTVDAGNLSTLNAPEEVELAEALVDLHPWSSMVRFARSGGEACAIAVRIARASSGKDAVAFCGYHGWHDWYLAANLQDESALDRHLLAGLEPNGVPAGLAGTARSFPYNDLDALRQLMSSSEIGVVYLEVERSMPPAPGFLAGVRQLADDHDAVLVFDECSSGFRKVVGGLHLHYGVEPDIAVFGKTLGNGYAVTAVVGREAAMQSAQDTFISSTLWTERIGSAAGVATLQAMREEDAPRRIAEIGDSIARAWEDLGSELGLPIRTSGMPAIKSFVIEGLDPIAVKTYVTGQMLERGFLATTAVYASIAHEPEIVERYLEALHPVLARLASVDGDDDLRALLPDGPAHAGFERLN